MFVVREHFYLSTPLKWVKVQKGLLGIYDAEDSEQASDFILLRSDTTVKERDSSNSPFKFDIMSSSYGHFKSYRMSTQTEDERKELLLQIRQQIDQNPIPVAEIETPIEQNNEEEPFTLRVCSYNVNFGCCGYPPYDEFEESVYIALMKANADVVLFQETTLEWEQFFRHKKLQDIYPFEKYQHYFVPENIQRPDAGGIAIVSKYPITSCELIESPSNWFPAQFSVIETPIGDVQLMNLHLRPPLTESALPLPHAYFFSKKDRMKESQWYGTYIDPNLPVITCGDFNENSTAASCTHWTKNLLMRSALDIFNGGNTWWWKLPGGFIVRARFDHIFYRGLKCSYADVIPEGVSDHYPVYADFHLN